ncbi:hypothetical protein JQU17_18315 [Ponticoccus sp. SC2-23]|uniref:alpha/beta fold hydrolase n=1 Tax=Alexandriicola marinus TaxID=2081710 RepID=UPI000FD7A526|nr:hypothetical protein [Alexandriicola marinus]MBM1222331.1 hypothetical protein [Ponticoccus sp. SC6-9]MBM1224444.1 hypothetical protein [Ponticoccus sp. SC6-15]MBM1229776.1 hypothetical protein [Ponticoccus sp. SC6-38]MBM1233410.1 hypothetical protein [Ponticoccus sp. SC6-45]MBM1236640.1 hypothetical protein [Ponticoccus sp. SC6-49]MBM1244684.1 hypothetical protein [Ponticoccus sp. SC2-64]MBM1246934.1 hypothetical protein [Ponticoccus sp. SC6-42]MBM1254649.1 hypothetical protein [Pontico
MTNTAFGPWRGLAPVRADQGPQEVCDAFARHLYGPVPPAPRGISIEREPCGPAERLTLGIGGATFDALLWLPDRRRGPVPVIAALDFLGPLGVPGVPYPIDEGAIICAPQALGGEGQRLAERMRGRSPGRWPIEAIHEAGFGLLLSCYGSWVPDDPDAWQSRGLAPRLGSGYAAISLWAWALMRLVDAAEGLEGVGDVVLAGHSRLGKAALWAGANDPRVAGVFANASGCAGAAPEAHLVGETLADLTRRYPHWLRMGAGLPEGLDQHHLLAAIAPRLLVVTGARDDIWADPVGSYRALCAASGVNGWPDPARMWSEGGVVRRGAMCHALRDGEHDLTPQDWSAALSVLGGAFS